MHNDQKFLRDEIFCLWPPGLGIRIRMDPYLFPPPPPRSEFGRENFKNNNRKSAGKFLIGNNNNNKLLKFKKQIKIKSRAETEQQTLRLLFTKFKKHCSFVKMVTDPH